MMYDLLWLNIVLSQATSVFLKHSQYATGMLDLHQVQTAPMHLAAPQGKVQATKEDHYVDKYLWCCASK